MEKNPASLHRVHFTDCDPFGHLNNSRYLDYFLNAREEHLQQYYDFVLQDSYKKGNGWVVASHEIIYLQPALYNETVTINSCLLHGDEQELLVEMSMTNKEKTRLKALLWTRFTPVSLQTGKKLPHAAEFMDFIKEVVTGIPENEANTRARVAGIMGRMRSGQ